ncbi:MAG: rhodanese-like domain-containing protein [Marinobacter sp.]|uniref:rhodanese-like domain-containing protein n=1 Tax=Marinobacter sp. TaxID=50741 RepID=UPI00299F41E0|nr:rhodanese-like domain-containing protein [Marinobacter sp.]MDX1757520.1 rhodanese-like domain-containing protein [Marinobacter sp.]
MKAITRDELKRMNEEQHRDFVLVNVLPREQFNERHIRTSINVPLTDDNFTQEVETVAGDKHREVVVYCANFQCDASAKAAEKLEAAGFDHVFDYEGGTQDWFEQKQAS